MKTMERLRPVNSRQNALVKELRQALAKSEPTEDGYIAGEGFHIVEEALRSGLKVKAVFFSQWARNRAERLLPQLKATVETLVLPDEIFRSAVTTENPQGVAALIKLKAHSMDAVMQSPDSLALVCAGIQDPGNLGTIIRSAEAFGASGVLLSEGSVSPFNAKVVRAAAGSLFRLPVLKTEATTLLEQLRAGGMKLVGASARAGKPLPEADLRGKAAIFIGAEGAGLPPELIKQMDELITVPHSPKVESLNAAMAAAVVLYEAARQRALSPQRHRGTEE